MVSISWHYSGLLRAIPAARGITESGAPVRGDGDGVFKLYETPLWVLQGRLDRQDHRGLERHRCIIGGIRNGTVVRQTRRFVAHETHPMRDEVQRRCPW